METTRRCVGCEIEQPIENFERDARYRGGHMPRCHDCRTRQRHDSAQQRAVTVESKTCTRCNCEQPAAAFHADKRSPDGLAQRCRTCKRETRYIEDPRVIKDRMLRWKYGISLDEYESILTRQGGGCAICGDPPAASKRMLHVDHCHGSGRVRGLLCSACNTALGLLREDPVVIASLLKYAERDGA